MRSAELEEKYLSKVRVVGSLALLSTANALELLNDCRNSDVDVLGVETFRIVDGHIQPSLEFSHISFGQVSLDGTSPVVESFGRQPRQGWEPGPELIELCRRLVEEANAHGYEWAELSIRDRKTHEMILFRGLEQGA